MNEPVQFTSDTLKLLKRLDDAPAGLRVQMARAVDTENQLTVGHIAQRYLSQRGPDTLGVVSNRLRSSLWGSKARVVSGMILSSIGSNVAYLAPHEYGFDGPVQVRSFTRRNREGDQFLRVKIGSVLNPDGTIRKESRRASSRAKVASGISFVKAHTRHAHYAERAPVRRGIADRVPAYSVALEQATLGYITGGKS